MLLHYPPSLRHRRFRLLWFGQLISIAGSQMQVWALFWHIRLLTAEPIYLGGIGLARVLPIIIFSLVGGAVADQTNRKGVLYITQTSMAMTALALGAFTFSGSISLWHIYALTALQAVAIAFDTPARQAIIPNLVPGHDLPNAFSLISIGQQTGAIVGPAIGGFVIAQMGIGYTYLFNALSFGAVLVSLLFIGTIPQQSRPGLSPEKRVGFNIQSIADGVRFIVSSPMILSTMLVDFFATFFSSANTLMPIVAVDVLKVGEVEYGWLSAAQAIGAGMAALTISQLPRIRRQGFIFIIAVFAFGLATVGFGLAGSFPLAVVMLVLIGASDSVSTIIRNTIRQLQTPDHIRGRMVSINQIFFMGGPQLGEMEAGAVAQFFGAPFAIVSGGIGCLMAVAWTVRRWPHLLRYNGDEPVAAGVKPTG